MHNTMDTKNCTTTNNNNIEEEEGPENETTTTTTTIQRILPHSTTTTTQNDSNKKNMTIMNSTTCYTKDENKEDEVKEDSIDPSKEIEGLIHETVTLVQWVIDTIRNQPELLQEDDFAKQQQKEQWIRQIKRNMNKNEQQQQQQQEEESQKQSVLPLYDILLRTPVPTTKYDIQNHQKSRNNNNNNICHRPPEQKPQQEHTKEEEEMLQYDGTEYNKKENAVVSVSIDKNESSTIIEEEEDTTRTILTRIDNLMERVYCSNHPPEHERIRVHHQYHHHYQQLVQLLLMKQQPSNCVSQQQQTPSSFDSSQSSSYHDTQQNQQRFLLVHNILLPLLVIITQCYTLLDNNNEYYTTKKDKYQQPSQQKIENENVSNILSNNANTIQSTNKNMSGRKPVKPLPPVGMLSLQNYTDIACLIELIICYTILPSCLILVTNNTTTRTTTTMKTSSSVMNENNNNNNTMTMDSVQSIILPPIQHRIRYQISKSLLGRLPKSVLLLFSTSLSLWDHYPTNTPYPHQQQQRLFQKQQQQQQKHQDTHIPTFSTIDTTTIIPGETIRTKYQCFELQRVVSVLGKLLLLERFRPMLLPKYMIDLYAATLLIQYHLPEKGGGGGQGINRNDSNKGKVTCSNEQSGPIQQLQEEYDVVYVRLFGTQPEQTILRNNPDKKEQVIECADGVLQAKIYQSILMQSNTLLHPTTTKTSSTTPTTTNPVVTMIPQWVQQQVTEQLSKLATTDLWALLVVFVFQKVVRVDSSTTKSSLNSISTSSYAGACKRFAQAIVMKQSPTPIITTTKTTKSTTAPIVNVNDKNTNQYYQGICDQLLSLVDSIILESRRLAYEYDSSLSYLEYVFREVTSVHNDNNNNKNIQENNNNNDRNKDYLNKIILKPQYIVTLHTIWAILDGLLSMNSSIRAYFFQQMTKNILTAFMDDCDDDDDENVLSNFIEETKKVVGSTCTSTPIQMTMYRMGLLLCSIPPYAGTNGTSKFCRLLFLQSPQRPSSQVQNTPTMLGLLIRLASTKTVFLKSNCKVDACVILRMLPTIFGEFTFTIPKTTSTAQTTTTIKPIAISTNEISKPKKTTRVDGIDVLTTAILHALVPCEWDMKYYFHLGRSIIDHRVSPRTILLHEEDPDTKTKGDSNDDEVVFVKTTTIHPENSSTYIVERMEHWMKTILQEILLVKQEQQTEEQIQNDTIENRNIQTILSFMFRTLLLLLYVSKEKDNHNDINDDKAEGNRRNLVLPSLFTNMDGLSFLPFVTLPILCETINPEILLGSTVISGENDDGGEEGADGGGGLLDVMGLIFTAVTTTTTTQQELNEMPSSGDNDFESDVVRNIEKTGICNHRCGGTALGTFLSRWFHSVQVFPYSNTISKTTATKKKSDYNTINRTEMNDDDVSSGGNIPEKNAFDACTATLFVHDAPTDMLVESITSILLSLLLVILELGNIKRSAYDEAMFQSYVPALQVLSTIQNPSHRDRMNKNDQEEEDNNDDQDTTTPNVTLTSEIAEMASHATTLIMSRFVSHSSSASITNSISDPNVTTEKEKEKDMRTIFHDKLYEAEIDLQSIEPPIRARGMVTLRHLSNAIVSYQDEQNYKQQQKEQNEQNIDQKNQYHHHSPLIQVLDDDSTTTKTGTMKDQDDLLNNNTEIINSSHDHHHHDLFVQIFLLAIRALQDKESFVYLAAIHTIVGICSTDATSYQNKNQILRYILVAICTGDVPPSSPPTIPSNDDKNNQNNSNLNNNSMMLNQDDTDKISMEQRIKLTEALIFIIRRRYRTILYSDAPYLMDYMIFGKVDNEQHDTDHNKKINEKNDIIPADHQATTMIHKYTHNYFMKGSYTDDQDENDEKYEEYDDVQDEDEKIKELEIRLKSGGPVFVVEESELLQSGRVHVLCEILGTTMNGVESNVQLITVYVPILIHYAVELLHFNKSSRLLRRAGASLAKELYALLVREQEELLFSDHFTNNNNNNNSNMNMNDIINNQIAKINRNTTSPKARILPVAVAFASNNSNLELLLCSTLRRCCIPSLDKNNDLNNGTIPPPPDPAMIARCQEAYELRQQAIEGGILAAGILLYRHEKAEIKKKKNNYNKIICNV